MAAGTLVTGFLVALANLMANSASATGLTAGQMREFSQNNILYYDPTACTENVVSSVAPTGDQISSRELLLARGWKMRILIFSRTKA